MNEEVNVGCVFVSVLGMCYTAVILLEAINVG